MLYRLLSLGPIFKSFSHFSTDQMLKITVLVCSLLVWIFGQYLVCLVGNGYVTLYTKCYIYIEILSLSPIFKSFSHLIVIIMNEFVIVLCRTILKSIVFSCAVQKTMGYWFNLSSNVNLG